MNVSTSVATILPEPEILEAHKRTRNPEDGISHESCEDKVGLQNVELHQSHPNPSVIQLHDSISQDENYYPEGGLRAWSVVFGSFMSLVASFGIINAFGTFQAYLSEHQLRNYDHSTVGWVFSVYVFFTFFCGVQIGPIFDAKGPRALILVGSVLLITCMMLVGICTSTVHISYRFMDGAF